MPEMVTDPVCGMRIRPEEAAASEEHQGRTIYFCSPGCRAAFVKDPDRYTQPQDQ